jgi:hypothetical protein
MSTRHALNSELLREVFYRNFDLFFGLKQVGCIGVRVLLVIKEDFLIIEINVDIRVFKPIRNEVLASRVL